MWSREHLLQAAKALDLLTAELRSALGAEVSNG